MTNAEIAVGVEFVDIAGVLRSIQTFGDRYLHRVFTGHEISSCERPLPSAASSLAARFAAKEATLKLLAPTGRRPDWRSIEVVRLPTGVCRLRLRGAAARLAVQRGLGPFALSMTHEAGMAAAVVVSGSAYGWHRPMKMESHDS